jgi:hypothetical protein
VLATSSGATASAPPPLAGVGLTTCSYNDARHSIQWVLQYLESLKDAETDQEGNRSSLHCFMLLVLLTHIALTAKLEAVEEVLAEERAAWQVADLALQAS